MKNNKLIATKAVLESFSNLSHSNNKSEKHNKINSEAPIQNEKFQTEPKSIPIFKLNLVPLAKKKFEIANCTWIVYDNVKELFAEYSPEGNLEQFYKPNENTIEMESIIEKFGNDRKKNVAILKIEGLLNLVWFGENIPDPEPQDTFVLFGNKISGIKKNVPIVFDKLLDQLSIVVKHIISTNPSKISNLE